MPVAKAGILPVLISSSNFSSFYMLKKSNFSILIKTHFLGDIGRYLILQMCCRTISTYCQPHDFQLMMFQLWKRIYYRLSAFTKKTNQSDIHLSDATIISGSSTHYILIAVKYPIVPLEAWASKSRVSICCTHWKVALYVLLFW